MQFADDRHASDDLLEKYSMGRLAGAELADLEEHLLLCELCQDRLAHEDQLRQSVRDAAAASGLVPRAASVRPPSPKLAWVVGMAAVALLTFAGVAWRAFHPSQSPPAVILLQATRGPETSLAAPAGRPLALALDLTGLPRLSAYKVEIVDAHGNPVLQSTGVLQGQRLQAAVARGLPSGAYFVRLYNPAGELLREYPLAVHD